MEALRWLRDAGITVVRTNPQPSSDEIVRADTILEVSAGEAGDLFVVEERRRTPYPNELDQLTSRRRTLHRRGQPLLIVPFVSEPLGAALTDAGWSWADEHGNFDLRAPGLTLRQRRAATAPRPRHRTLPQGSGSLAIVRSLIRFSEGEEEELQAIGLARQAGVSQPRVSQVLGRLLDLGLIEKSTRGRWIPHRADLLDRFLDEYRGPGGSEHYLYNLDGPTDAAVRITRAHTTQHPVAVSADVGPDLLQAWRRPSIAIIYLRDDIAPESVGLVEAQGRHDANVILRVPHDRSVFRNPELVATAQGVDVPLADESQQIWDLRELGGADRLEGAGVLREWLLTHP